MKLHYIAVVVCAFALQGCATFGIETCGLGSTRCKGNTVQICKTGLGWTDSAECNDVGAAEGGTWTCGTPKGVCLTAEGLLDTARAVKSRLHDLPIERRLCAAEQQLGHLIA